MLILGIVIGILIIIASVIADYEYDCGFFGVSVGFVVIIASLIGMFICFHDIGQAKIIDKKITMYQEENKNIEEQINNLVKEYMEYEGSTLKEFSSESSITLITMYPDLKSDELVKAQIETYTKNNNKIKELKEDKLDYRLTKWWIYFGK